jgi:hypothetical protein
VLDHGSSVAFTLGRWRNGKVLDLANAVALVGYHTLGAYGSAIHKNPHLTTREVALDEAPLLVGQQEQLAVLQLLCL